MKNTFLKTMVVITAILSLAPLSAETNIQKLEAFKDATYRADNTRALIAHIEAWSPNGADAQDEVLTKSRANEAALLVIGNAADIVVAKEAATAAASKVTPDEQSTEYEAVFNSKTAAIKTAVSHKFNEAAGNAAEGWLTTASLAGKMNAMMTQARSFGQAIATATRDALTAGRALIDGIGAQISAAIDSIRNYTDPAHDTAARHLANPALA